MSKTEQDLIDILTKEVEIGTKEFDLVVDLLLSSPNTTMKQVAAKLNVPYYKLIKERSRYVDEKISKHRNP